MATKGMVLTDFMLEIGYAFHFGLALSILLAVPLKCLCKWKPIAVIAVESAVKYSFVLKDMQTRQRGNYKCKVDPFTSFVCQASDNCNHSYFD